MAATKVSLPILQSYGDALELCSTCPGEAEVETLTRKPEKIRRRPRVRVSTECNNPLRSVLHSSAKSNSTIPPQQATEEEYRASVRQILLEHVERSVDALSHLFVERKMVSIDPLPTTSAEHLLVPDETCRPISTQVSLLDDTTEQEIVPSKSLTSSAMDAIYVQRAVNRFLKKRQTRQGKDTKKASERRVLGSAKSRDLSSEEDPPSSIPSSGYLMSDAKGSIESPPKERRRHTRKSVFFTDSEDVKYLLRNAMLEPDHDIQEFYWDTGICQNIVKRPAFEYVTLFVIAINALWFAFDIDWNHAKLLIDADPVFIVADNLFCAYYTAEIWLRFFSFRNKRDILEEKWFLFDAALWVSIVFDVWVLMAFPMFGLHEGLLNNTVLLRCFRIGRLVRLCRMIEVFRAVPELMVLIKGMGTAIKAVSAFVIWMLFIIYMFALVFRQLTDGTTLGDLRFKSIPESVWYLVLTGIIPDVADNAEEIWNEGGALQAGLYLVFCVLVSITVMNMLVGMLVGVVQSYAYMEKEEMVIEKVKATVLDTLNKIDTATADAMMSKAEFDMLMRDRDAVESFDLMGVDVVGLVDFGNQIFADNRELPIQAFIELLMELRGNNHATVKDIVDLRRFVDMHVQAIEELLHMTHDGKFKCSEANLAREKARAGPLDHLVSNLPTAVLPSRTSVLRGSPVCRRPG